MINYNNGKIYKLEPNCEYDEGDIYIGSTTKRLLCQRMATHRLEYRKWKDGLFPKYTCFDIFDKYGIDNIKIVLLELVGSNTCSLDELNAKESEYIKNTKCLNKPIPIRPKFHFDYNKERFIKRNKEQL